jgi:hypothetical protein
MPGRPSGAGKKKEAERKASRSRAHRKGARQRLGKGGKWGHGEGSCLSINRNHHSAIRLIFSIDTEIPRSRQVFACHHVTTLIRNIFHNFESKYANSCHDCSISIV